MNLINICVKDSNETTEVPRGINLAELSKGYQKFHSSPIMAAKSENSLIELSKLIDKDTNLEFIDLSDPDGVRIYTRGVLFLLFMAARELFGKVRLYVHHSLGSGLVCELTDVKMDEENLARLKEKMKEFVSLDLAFTKETIGKFEAVKLFSEDGQREKSSLFKYRKKSTVNIYCCGKYFNYFYGYMPVSTGQLREFELLPYGEYFLLNLPTTNSPDRVPELKDMPKLAKVFMEYEKWGRILGVKTVGELNGIITKGNYDVAELIRVAEALHEKKIANIADRIAEREETRLILVAGPSSSGKTTFSKRLMLQLKVIGMRPIQISLDDYFVDREKTPLDENGNYDFESIYALDLDLFNSQIMDLLNGKEVRLPRFDFRTGKRSFVEETIKLKSDQPIIVEGIHGLNEVLSSSIDKNRKFKIYVSALAQMNLDDMNRIPTTDVRLLRRIVRDYRFRGHSALSTIAMWNSVRRGEEKYIFPFQEEANSMFNSSLIYEVAVLKMFAEPLLVQIDDSVPEYSEAKRLLRFIDYFLPIPVLDDISRTSIIREFIGGSTFRY